MMKFLDPTNDLAFKKIFGNEQKKNILISFINAILDFQSDHLIAEVEIANPYQVPKIEELKETILDVQAVDQAGRRFIVEMQKNDKGDFQKRSLYYTAKAYTAQLASGEAYKHLKKVYFIGIVNFNIFETAEYISRHLILDKKTHKQEIADFEFSFVELSKFQKTLEEAISIADKWLFFLKNAKNLEIIPDAFEKIEAFKDAFYIANSFGWDKRELEVYDYMRLKEMDRNNEIETAENKGIAKGIEKGMQKSKIEIASNLLDILEDAVIAEKTGLSIATVKALRDAEHSSYIA